jgi:hypothetical protein
MSWQSLYIRFDGRHVAVHSDVPELLAGVERVFAPMLAPAGAEAVGWVEVGRPGAKYQLRANGEAVREDKSLGSTLHWIGYQVVLRLMQARSDLIWLHASAAACPSGAVLIAGPAGRGKSTLVTALCARGWTYLSDDILPLDPQSDKVMPFPQTPMVRRHAKEEVPGDRIHEMKKTRFALGPGTVCREAVPVAGLVFPVYEPPSSTRITPCSSATAALLLLQNCLNFQTHGERAVHYFCELVKRLPTFQLSFQDGGRAAELISLAVEAEIAQAIA